VACYRHFGWLLSMPLIHAVVGYFFLTDRAGRRASRDYLHRIDARLGQAPHAWRPGLRESFLHYRDFALAITDRIALWGGREKRFSFEWRGQEPLLRLLSQRRGALLLGAHLGSFDALRVLSHRDGVRVNVLMYTRHAPHINRIFAELSPDVDLRVIHAEPDSVRTAFEIRACIDRGEFVAILADRAEPLARRRTLRVDFLGAPARLPEAPFLLSVVLGCPTFLTVALRRGRRNYAVIAEPLQDERSPARRGKREEQVLELARRYATQLEQHCLSAHRQWFNFFDFWEAGEPG